MSLALRSGPDASDCSESIDLRALTQTLTEIDCDVPRDSRSLLTAIDAMPVGVSWANLADLKIVFTNRKFTEIFGYVEDDFTDVPDWIARTYPFEEDRELVSRTWGAYFAGPRNAESAIEPIEIRVQCKDGTIKTILNSGIILPDTGWALATFIDISDRKKNELELQRAHSRAAENEVIYRFLLDHSTEMIILSPTDITRRYVSSAVEKITGFTQAEYLAIDPINTFHPDDRKIAIQCLLGLHAGNMEQIFRYRILRKDQSYRWVEATVRGYVDPISNKTGGYVGTVRDIAEEVERDERLQSRYSAMAQVAHLDDLTGLANRRAFRQSMATQVLRHEHSTRDLSLLMIDVDCFKAFNDRNGHLLGDACLKAIAAALQRSVHRDSDVVARFGGEEFVILLPTTGTAGAEIVARTVLEAVAALNIAHEQSPHGTVSVSIGVTTWPAGTTLDPQTLMDRADQALYRAKAQGRNCLVTG